MNERQRRRGGGDARRVDRDERGREVEEKRNEEEGRG